MLNIEEIKKHIDYLHKDKYYNEFYVALLIYDVLGKTSNEIDEEMIEKIYEIEDRYDSIYNESLREELFDEYIYQEGDESE